MSPNKIIYYVGFTIYDVGFTIYDVSFTIYDVSFTIYDVGFTNYDIFSRVSSYHFLRRKHSESVSREEN